MAKKKWQLWRQKVRAHLIVPLIEQSKAKRDSPFFPAPVANQNTGLSESCLLEELAI